MIDGKSRTNATKDGERMKIETTETNTATVEYRLFEIFNAVKKEAESALIKWPSWASAHEGYAVLLEEVDELWEHVKTNQKNRDIPAMKKEAIQVAAMAIRFAIDCCDETSGRK